MKEKRFWFDESVEEHQHSVMIPNFVICWRRFILRERKCHKKTSEITSDSIKFETSFWLRCTYTVLAHVPSVLFLFALLSQKQPLICFVNSFCFYIFYLVWCGRTFSLMSWDKWDSNRKYAQSSIELTKIILIISSKYHWIVRQLQV